MDKSIVLHLGSNLGDRKIHLTHAFQKIEQRIGSITAYSKIYETEAWGKQDQPDYLNAAIQVETDLSPHEVIQASKAIEAEEGSAEKKRWSERKLDIDLLFYNELVIQEEDLRVPHPFIHKRNFVLVPLNDIVPFFRHPVLNRTIEELCYSSRDPLSVEVYEKNER